MRRCAITFLLLWTSFAIGGSAWGAEHPLLARDSTSDWGDVKDLDGYVEADDDGVLYARGGFELTSQGATLTEVSNSPALLANASSNVVLTEWAVHRLIRSFPFSANEAVFTSGTAPLEFSQSAAMEGNASANTVLSEPAIYNLIRSFAWSVIDATDISNWNTAYGWGDHGAANYLDLDTYPNADTDSTDDCVITSGTSPTEVTQSVSGGAGDATTIVSEAALIHFMQAHDWSVITSGDISNWDTAYGWGDHSAEIDGDIATHAADVDAHHARYTDAEAVTAVDTEYPNLDTDSTDDFTITSGTTPTEFSQSAEAEPGDSTTFLSEPAIYNLVRTVMTSEGASHDPVTLAGQDYLTLSTQQITAGLIDLADDVTGLLPEANIDAAIARDSEVAAHTGDEDAHHDFSGLTDGYLPKASSTELTDSAVYEAGGSVGIGTASPDLKLHVYNGNSGASHRANEGMVLETDANGILQMLAPDANYNEIVFGTPTDNHDGGIAYYSNLDRLYFWTGGDYYAFTADATGMSIGGAVPAAKLDVRGSAIFNEDHGDNDFRVEGYTDANLLFADASTDRVGIGTASPGAKLDVSGSAYIDGNVGDGGDTDTYIDLSDGGDEISMTMGGTEMFSVGNIMLVPQINIGNGLFTASDGGWELMFGGATLDCNGDNTVITDANFTVQDDALTAITCSIFSDDSDAPVWLINKSGYDTALGTKEALGSGNTLGAIKFRSPDSDEEDWLTAARVIVYQDAAAEASGYNPGRMHFETGATGGTLNTNQLVLDSSGYIGLGVGSPSYQIEHSSGAKLDSGTWTDSSSVETKRNIETLDTARAWERVDEMRPVRFERKQMVRVYDLWDGRTVERMDKITSTVSVLAENPSAATVIAKRWAKDYETTPTLSLAEKDKGIRIERPATRDEMISASRVEWRDEPTGVWQDGFLSEELPADLDQPEGGVSPTGIAAQNAAALKVAKAKIEALEAENARLRQDFTDLAKRVKALEDSETGVSR